MLYITILGNGKIILNFKVKGKCRSTLADIFAD